jgi:DNA-binding response OmpR family regulator
MSVAVLPAPRQALVVDDSPDIRALVQALLARSGFRTEAAEDGEDALAKLESFTPDVILLDLGMPKMDGFAFLREKARIETLKPIPVMALSARDQNRDVVEALELGADGYIAKPFDNRNLVERVKQLLDR